MMGPTFIPDSWRDGQFREWWEGNMESHPENCDCERCREVREADGC